MTTPNDESLPSMERKALRRELKIACAIAHSGEAGVTLHELVAFVLEHGLPPKAERERIRDERLTRGDND